MILLTKCLLDNTNLYHFASADTPSNGSETCLYQNIVEMANILDPFEIVYAKVEKNTKNYNMDIDNTKAIEIIKPLYQVIRHGLAFDWVMNHLMTKILDVLPAGHQYPIFKGTAPFIEQHAGDDLIFATEIANIEAELDTVFKWVFGDESINCLKDINLDDITIKKQQVLDNSKYLVFLVEMLSESIGQVVLHHWTDHFTKMGLDHPYVQDDVIVVGGQYRAFAYGNIDGTGIKWHLLSNGIGMSGSYRTQRKDYVRVFPDEMTFVRFENDTMYIDETYFPMISIDDGEFTNAIDFLKDGLSCSLDAPHKLTISYKFKQDINTPKQIKLRAGENCVIKDQLVTLDINGKAETQIVFKGNSATFKIADPDKKYPFAFFTTKTISGNSSSFAWLQ
jgi:hypothetical protein